MLPAERPTNGRGGAQAESTRRAIDHTDRGRASAAGLPRAQRRNAERGARSSRLAVWGRRLITVPAYTALCLLAVGAFPLLLGLAAVADLIRGGPWAVVRCVTFLTFYLCCEVFGILASVAAWLGSGLFRSGRQERFLRWHYDLENWWARTLFRGAQHVFAMRTEVEETDDLGRGPVIVFIRHASVGDTLLPAVFLSSRYGLRLRYVLKQELLWDPCLDIVGNRLPNYFVRRASGDSEAEIAAVRELVAGLGPTEGVLIYPEGTRFTPAKREQVLRRLAQAGNAELLEKARALRHVLPPRLGGPLGLLEGNPGADVIFCAHTGFEGAASFRELISGSLVHQVVRICFWRVPFDAIPPDRAGQRDWLYAQWARVDDWVGTRQA